MFCKHCNTLMRSVMRFEPNKKSYKVYRCPKCYSETKPIPLIFTPQEIVMKTRMARKKANNKKKNKTVRKSNDYKR